MGASREEFSSYFGVGLSVGHSNRGYALLDQITLGLMAQKSAEPFRTPPDLTLSLGRLKAFALLFDSKRQTVNSCVNRFRSERFRFDLFMMACIWE
jgi:hypothetical protein